MNIFLTWYSKRNLSIRKNITNDLLRHYQSFLTRKLSYFNYSNRRTGIICISDIDFGYNTNFLQKNRDIIAFMTGTPSKLKKLITDKGYGFNKNDYMIKVYEILVRHGFDNIKDISPPFVFGFLNIKSDSMILIHDGLGYEQCFYYEDDDFFIASNKCWPIIKFTGKKFDVNLMGWKYLFKYSYFPLEFSPFDGISFLGPGEIIICNQRGINKDRIDCFNEWFSPLQIKKLDLLEYARLSFNESIKESIEIYCNNNTQADLSGGRDSRTIMSSLLNQGVECIYNTTGDEYSADVRVVKMLEEKYKLKVRHRRSSLMGIDKDTFIAKLKKFISWQDGLGDFKSSKYFKLYPHETSPVPYFSGLTGNCHRLGTTDYGKYTIKKN